MKYLFKRKIWAAAASALDLPGRGVTALIPRRPAKTPPRHALIIRLDHLGDILPATAVPKLLKESLGVARVSFLTSSAGAALLESNPFVDEVLAYDAPWFSRGKRVSRASYLGLARRLRKMDIDLGLSLRGDIRENLLLALAGIRRRVGYGVTGGGFLLTDEAAYRWGVHESRHTLDLLQSLGIHAEALEPRLYWSAEEKERMEEKRAGWGMKGGDWIGLQIDAGTRAKEWPLEHWKHFLQGASERLPQARIVLVGGDRERGRALAGKHPGILNLAGRTDLRELFYLLGSCSLFIGPDSGPAHIAASMGVPTLFLYSGTNSFEEWKSLAEGAEFLRNPVPCSPCQLTECPVKGHPCMSGIEPVKALDWAAERSRGR